MTPKISLFASASRPKFWKRLYDSLSGNVIDWEIVFVGPNAPDFALPENFKYVASSCKPAQCYQAASQFCMGEIIGWMADDADYEGKNSLDAIWERYTNSLVQYNDKKTIISQKTIEDYRKYNTHVEWEKHRLFYGNFSTPQMAPLGFMNRDYFNQLGGYDKNFVCGQSENDIVMRVLEDGGRVIGVTEPTVLLQHSECHGQYEFSRGYRPDRSFLESCWTQHGQVVRNRLQAFEPFNSKDILIINQGPVGHW